MQSALVKLANCRNLFSLHSVKKKPYLIFKHNCSSYTSRSHTCGELSLGHVDTRVTLAGWLQATRLDKFLLLRDRTGVCQVFIPESESSKFENIKNLTNESVIVVSGVVKQRPEGQENAKMETGDVEVELDTVHEVSPADPNPPLQQSKHVLAKEQLRLQYRYLDLRRPDLQYNLAFRSALIMKMREFLTSKKFLDIETPTLFRRTPGGAKEFIVPTRIENKYYSLVQSPQQFKQLLMVGGLDRYFQVARCYRDEGGKPDRQPEFTQLDIEMSFASRADIINLIQDLLQYCLPDPPNIPFEQMFYEDAMNSYGVDKPDLRYDNKIRNMTGLFKDSGFDFIDNRLGNDSFFVGGVFFDAVKNYDSKLLKNVDKDLKVILADHFKECKAKNSPIIVSSFSKNGEGVDCSVLKKCNEGTRQRVSDMISGNQLGFLVCGAKDDVLPVLGRVRIEMAKEMIKDLDTRPDKFLWVVDFPLFVMEEGRLEAAHHPFTAAHPDDYHMFRTSPLKCRSLHYDLVLNGQEIAGGSVRIHNSQDQRFVLEDVLGEDTAELQHLLSALATGCPPHAGIAIGLDRLVAIMTRASSIRDVIAFPKSSDGKDLMGGAPADITKDQRLLYNVK